MLRKLSDICIVITLPMIVLVLLALYFHSDHLWIKKSGAVDRIPSLHRPYVQCIGEEGIYLIDKKYTGQDEQGMYRIGKEGNKDRCYE